MYIKNKEVTKDYITFEVSPLFSSIKLVERCRALVDDYFTFTDFNTYSQRFNFRKYCLEPIFVEVDGVGRLDGICIKELLYKKLPILINVYKKGIIKIQIPADLLAEDRDIFITRFERMVQYVL